MKRIAYIVVGAVIVVAVGGFFMRAADEPVRILAVGDIMLDRTVRSHIEKEGNDYPFRNVVDLFVGRDIVVGNLEGGFTDNPSISIVDHSILHFTFDPSLAPALQGVGFNVLSLANNHTYDFGTAGYTSTVRYAEKAGIATFGSPSNDARLSTVKDVRGTKVALIGYHEFYSPSIKPITDEIAALRPNVDFIIVYPHWGVEYRDTPTEEQVQMAHAFIDAGADAVIGSHPHVIEPIEIYKSKTIFYSLGNFVFDQDFSKATTEGLAVGISISKKEVAYDLLPVYIKHSQLSLPSQEEKKEILKGTPSRFVLKR